MSTSVMSAGASNRVARGAVLLALWVATGALLSIVPIGAVWAAAQVSDSIGEHLVAAIPLTALAMTVWMFLIVWLNNLYLRLDGTLARIEADARAGWQRKRLRGPAEAMLVVWFFIALAAMAVWFFFFAENPSHQVI